MQANCRVAPAEVGHLTLSPVSWVSPLSSAQMPLWLRYSSTRAVQLLNPAILSNLQTRQGTQDNLLVRCTVCRFPREPALGIHSMAWGSFFAASTGKVNFPTTGLKHTALITLSSCHAAEHRCLQNPVLQGYWQCASKQSRPPTGCSAETCAAGALGAPGVQS